MYGNNVESTKMYRVTVPLFNEQGTVEDGMRYFLPQIPEIDGKYITGIEAHIRGSIGDLNAPILAYGKSGLLPSSTTGRFVFLYIKDNEKKEKNGYIPLISLFNSTATGQPKRIKPYYGKISTRDSFLTIPANSVGIKLTPIFVSLTFYYIQ